MILQEAITKKVRITRNKTVKEAVYGCDYCKTEILENKLNLTIFQKEDDNNTLCFCSWACTLRYISEINFEFDFISLPYVSNNSNLVNISKSLFQGIKPIEGIDHSEDC